MAFQTLIARGMDPVRQVLSHNRELWDDTTAWRGGDTLSQNSITRREIPHNRKKNLEY
jgi:hypothetical protein